MLILLRSSSDNTRGPVHAESLLRNLHRIIRRRHPLTLRIQSIDGEVGLGIECTDELSSVVIRQLRDAYPGLQTDFAASDHPSEDSSTWSLELHRVADVLPIRTYPSFLDDPERELADPITALLAAVRTGRAGKMRCVIETAIRPATQNRQRQSRRILEKLGRRFPSEEWRRRYLRLACDRRLIVRLAGRAIGLMSRKQSVQRTPADAFPETLYECHFVVHCTAPKGVEVIAKRRLLEIAAAFGQFTQGEATIVHEGVTTRSRRLPRRGSLMTPDQLATVWHPPTMTASSVSRLRKSAFKELEPPVWLPSKETERGVTTLGRVAFREQRTQFGIRTADLRRHVFVAGQTGSGKSTFLQNIVMQQIEQDRGVVLIDPHGQLVEELLDHIPRRRTNDVILFDASDDQFPISFNPLRGPPGSDPTLVADGVTTAFKKVFGFDEATAPRLLHIFRNCLLTLVGRPEATLISVQRLLADVNYRKTMTSHVDNPAVKEFWRAEFNRWSDRDRTQYVASLQNKLGAFTSNRRLQLILGSTEKGIDLRTVLDRSQILLCNLSKGTVGNEASTLLGSLLLSSLQLAAMSRANVPEAERPDASVIVDEFHSFLSEGNSTMADALAESRKYRTSYVLATQLLEQLDRATLAGVLGNCGTTMCMTVGPRDAEVLAELMGNGLTPADLMRVPRYHAYIRLLVDGTAHTFSMTTPPPAKYRQHRGEVIRRLSRERYGSSKTEAQSVVDRQYGE
ncbi:MAG: ATP-binding protein [Planctomycetaceae bacterium]|nr:ATP-binding protein [Planctomycetaceae bacterium]